MGYQDELDRLQNIITSDNSTEEQRDVAREAKRKLFSVQIEEIFERLRDRTAEYTALINRLKDVVDKITANQLTGVIDSIDDFVKDVTKDEDNQN